MSNTIENPYENFIALSRYARWLEDENRRETWGETVDRYFNFMVIQLREKHGYVPDDKILAELRDVVFNRNVMPSMRSVMTAGPALERENVAKETFRKAFEIHQEYDWLEVTKPVVQRLKEIYKNL